GDSHPNKVIALAGSDFVDLLEAIKAKKPVDITCDSDALTLHVKNENESMYIIIDSDIFEDEFQNDFSVLVEKFGIKRKNPIKVILPKIKSLTESVAAITPKADRIEPEFSINYSELLNSSLSKIERESEDRTEQEEIEIEFESEDRTEQEEIVIEF
ncbi:1585_t:CDS:2, partial [Acaulospora morrowiae]